MPVVSITLPSPLLKQFEEFINNQGYYSRSEAFRDALRNLMSETRLLKEDSTRVAATIVLTRDYARTDVENKISEIKHQHDDVMLESIHRHFEKKFCVDIFVAEGSKDRIMSVVSRIRGLRGIHQVKTVFVSLD